MKKIVFFIPLLLIADVNPFNAGVNGGYGLTPQEKLILENRKNIKNLEKNCDKVNKKLNKIELKLINYDEIIKDKLSAFPTFVDELNNFMNDLTSLKKRVNKLEKEFNQAKNNHNEEINNIKSEITQIKKEIELLKASINAVIETQNQNYQNLKLILEKFIKEVNKKLSQKELTPKEAFYKAKRLFYDGRLSESKKLFLYVLSHNFLPATTSYYLGEIAFKEGNYKKALAYYKNSVDLYSKPTSFTTRLLYHTGIAFLRLNNKNAAKLTFQKLIHDFPSSKYAALAKKELEKIK